MNETSGLTRIVFFSYIGLVFLIAALSHRILSKKSFLSEYFLGSRSLGAWTLAFTFAATSASGGSFGGYPSLIYSYGWVLALWISSYMVFPLTTMGVLGKRLNQVGRQTGAITIPDVLRDRFESPAIGLFSSCTIIIFNTAFLVAQFKLGALIIEDTLSISWITYREALMIFAVTVIFYTAYGGFRAVVWTDVLQGVVMGGGVILLLPVIWQLSGGMQQATENLMSSPARAVTAVPGPDSKKGFFNDLVFEKDLQLDLYGIAYQYLDEPNLDLQLRVQPDGDGHNWLVAQVATDGNSRPISTGNDVKRHLEQDPQWGDQIRVTFPYKNDETQFIDSQPVSLGATGVIGFPAGVTEHRFAFIDGADRVFGPGRKDDGNPFHPLGMIVSFCFMWAIVGIGQPSNMVRLLAFRDSRTLKRAIIAVSIFFALIYLPLIFVVMSARSLMPVLNAEESDRTIVLIATQVVAKEGVLHQILGALLVAAPFAAVMSTVDSFLLMISSSAVRDVYQRSINPNVGEKTVRRASYLVTLGVGVLVTILAIEPIEFLQNIIVFVSGGFAATFLCPTLLGLYWSRTTRAGALSAMLGGFATVVALGCPKLMQGNVLIVLGIEPAVWGLVVSLLLGVLVSLFSGPPAAHLVARYFPTASGSTDSRQPVGASVHDTRAD